MLRRQLLPDLPVQKNRSPVLETQVFRETGGQALVWGSKPQKITAHYTTGDGSTKTSLLLASGAPQCTHHTSHS